MNFASSIGGQFITLLMQFIVRTVFIATLGKSYLGISSLFSNILSMLSLAELGVGSAILFKLYKLIAEENHHRIALLMKFYKRIYQAIGIAVFVIGLCLIPFLPNLIKNYDRLAQLHINAVLVFVLFLFKSAASYFFFAYKSAIIKAHQKAYVVSLVQYAFLTISSIAQIVCLYVFKSFMVYVTILILEVIGQNIFVAILANRMYPYINEKTDESISKDEVVGIFKDCGALFLYRLNQVVIKATDNIVISTFLGLDLVAMYSNYYIFYNTINTLFNKLFDSVVHSFGNLHTTGNKKHEYEVFESANLITAILGATAGVGIFVVSDEFVRTWIGKDWELAHPFALLMGIELFTLAFRKILGRYRNAMGLFQQAKWRPLAGMIINLGVSIALVNIWGICGVLVGTIVADWSTYMWFDPLIINKYGFEGIYSIKRYYFKFLKYFATACAVGAADYAICSHLLSGHGWISVIIHAIICGVTVPAVMLLACFRSAEEKYVLELGGRYVKRFKKKRYRG